MDKKAEALEHRHKMSMFGSMAILVMTGVDALSCYAKHSDTPMQMNMNLVAI